MGVKKLLKKQEESFLSLYETLYRMAQIDGAESTEAAQCLFRLLHATPSSGRPAWYVRGHTILPTLLKGTEDEIPWKCLEAATTFGLPGVTISENSLTEEDYADWCNWQTLPKDFLMENFTTYGFDKEEIHSFLAAHGLDITDTVPPLGQQQALIRTDTKSPIFEGSLSDALMECHAERAVLQRNMQELETRLAQQQKLEEDIKQLAEQVREQANVIANLNKDLDKLRDERDALKKDTLQGKGKKTALQLIGSLAILTKPCDMDVRESRLSKLNELTTALQNLGYEGEPQTVSSWIKSGVKALTG